MLDNLKDEYWHYSVSRQSQSIILACTGEFSLVWPHPVRQGYTPLLQNRVWHASVVSRAKFIQCLEWCISVSKVAGRVKLFWYITSSLLCGQIMTTPTFLLLKYGFLTDPRLEAKKLKRCHILAIVCKGRKPISSDTGIENHVIPKVGGAISGPGFLNNMEIK